jgi:hypothetical protein
MLHWEIEYRKIIGIYRNLNGKLLQSLWVLKTILAAYLPMA